jgi:hypothetical protein
MARFGRFIITLILTLLLSLSSTTAPAVANDTPVKLTGPAYPGMAPATVKFKIQIQPNPENRFAWLILDAASFYRSTRWELNGPREEERVTWWVEFKDLPAGEYLVLAVVKRRDGSESRDRRSMEILEGLPYAR